MKTLTIEDLKKLIGKKVKVHDGYVAFPGAIVEVKSVVPSAGVGGYNVEVDPQIQFGPLCISSDGLGIMTGRSIFVALESCTNPCAEIKTTEKKIKLKELRPGDRFLDIVDLSDIHYGPGVVVDFDDVPEDRKRNWTRDSWIWIVLDSFSGELFYNIGISGASEATIRVEDESDRVVNVGVYCSCSVPLLKENYAGGNKFFVCRNCGKEKL